MSLQVPAVTIEDLQAFQTKHFPGAHAHSTEETNQSRVEGGEGGKEEYYYYEDEEEYDLGYYPDGAKRTLTDEQIKIFRHSEIHALRREKQEREEEEEEHTESLREASKSTNAGGEGQDGASSGHVGSNESRMESVKGNAGSETATTLDYGGGLQVNSRSQHPASSVPFTGRKIVSYED